MNRIFEYAIAPFGYAIGLCFTAATAVFAGSVYLLQPVVERLQHRKLQALSTSSAMPQVLQYSASSRPLMHDEYGHQTLEHTVSPHYLRQSAALVTDHEECSQLLRKVEEGVF